MIHWKKWAAALLASAFLLAPAAEAAQLVITPDQLKDLLEEYYINDVPQAALEADTVEEIIQALGDPYTAYMDAEEFAAYEATMSDGALVGIGISALVTDEGLLLVSIYEDSPAEALGLVPGDLIYYVEGGPEEQSPNILTSLLQGEEGTEVTILVRHENGKEQRYTTKRAVITIPATTTTILEDGTTGYISSKNFGPATLEHFVKGTQDQSEIDKWIVDMRNNGGGDVYAASQSAGVFLGTGTMAYLRDGADQLFRYVSQQDRTTLHPAIVLVSPLTASSAEIYAQAMKDKTSGMIIGSNTYGKGVAQIVLTEEQRPEILSGGEAVRITAFQSYGSGGNTPQHIGVIPDLLVDPSPADEIALLFSSREPAGDHTGWARLHLGGWRWYLDLSQAKDEEAAPYFGELLSAIPPGCNVFLGTSSGWDATTVDAIAQASGAETYQPRRFTDLEGADCQFAADTLYTYGILTGMGDGSFAPNSGLTRAQLCALLVKALNLPAADRMKDFKDVPADSWFSPYVKAAQAAGYVQGMGNDVFAPNAPVTHEQLFTVLGRMAADVNLTFRMSSKTQPEDYGVPASYSDWAQPWTWLLANSQHNILGQPLSMLYDKLENIAPRGPATRGETALVLYTIFNAVDLIPY